MAEKHRMTPDEVVSYLLEGDGVDYVRDSLRWMVEQLMEAEVSELIGAERGERTDDRATHRNGYRPRRWDTRAGELELAIPKLRKGSYFPSFLSRQGRARPRRRALVRKCVVIAHGVHESGRREVIGLDVGEAETEAFWREFLRGLVARGLLGVQLAVSDAHPGLKAAIAQVLGCAWQRCTVHFLRDCLGQARKDQQPMLAALIRPIFAGQSRY